MAHCMWLKTIVAKAHYKGQTPRNPFAQYRINQNIKERQYLTEDEIKAVMTHEFANKKLAYIRNLFVFASFTALSFVNPNGMIPVPYLTFELADGNIKHYVKFQNDLDFSWKLKSLHDVANGLQQLHNIEIIHQDVKPSNILQFRDDSKLTDLDRSKCKSKKGPYDNYCFSGDKTYAPIEIYKEILVHNKNTTNL